MVVLAGAYHAESNNHHAADEEDIGTPIITPSQVVELESEEWYFADEQVATEETHTYQDPRHPVGVQNAIGHTSE